MTEAQGRLYRSSGASVDTASDAVPALSAAQLKNLRSVGEDVNPAAKSRPAGESIPPKGEPVSTAKRAPRAKTDETGISAAGVWALVTIPTVVIGFIDGFLNRGVPLGFLTGAVLLVTSIVAAFLVRRSARWWAVIVPPLAFLIATLTAGQFAISTVGGFIVREGLLIFTTLGANALWIVGSVIAAVAIVLLKKREPKRQPS